jgi:hypothetical protein
VFEGYFPAQRCLSSLATIRYATLQQQELIPILSEFRDTASERTDIARANVEPLCALLPESVTRPVHSLLQRDDGNAHDRRTTRIRAKSMIFLSFI